MPLRAIVTTSGSDVQCCCPSGLFPGPRTRADRAARTGRDAAAPVELLRPLGKVKRFLPLSTVVSRCKRVVFLGSMNSRVFGEPSADLRP